MKRRSVGWLFGSWVAYWVALFAVKLGPAVAAIWRATQSGGADQNNVSLSLGDWALSLVVSERGQTTWSGSIHLGALAAWIAIVPLAIWVAWFMSAKSDVPVREPV